MSNYYLVPIDESSVSIDGVSLYDILKSNYPDLLELLEKKRQMYFSYNFNEEEYSNYVRRVDYRFEELGVPKYIILSSREHDFHELISGREVKCEFTSRMHLVDYEKMIKYFNESNYALKIMDLFKTISLDNNITEAYIEGSIDGVCVSGLFRGKVKKLKLGK